MICRACDQPMTAGVVQTCPACGRTVTFRDLGYVPSAGFQPVPYRAETFAPLEEEKGWAQDDAPSLEERAPKRPHPARLPKDDPRHLAWRDTLSAAVHRANQDPDVKEARSAAQRRRMERERRRTATAEIDAATRKRALRGAQRGKWYAEQRGAA